MFKVDEIQLQQGQREKLIHESLELARSFLGTDSAVFYSFPDEHDGKISIFEQGNLNQATVFESWVQSDAIGVFENHVVAPVACSLGIRSGTLILHSNQLIEWSEQKTKHLSSLSLLMGESFCSHLTRKMIYKNSRLATLGQVTAEIMHEINNPICIIQAGLSLMLIQTKRESLSVDFFKNMLQKLLSSTKRVNQIITGVKNFSRNSESDPAEETIVSTLVQESMAFCLERFKTESVKFVQSELPESLKVSCRKIQVSQVLINLVNNAIDAVECTVDPWVKVSIEDRGDQVAIRVEDSGRGIPDQDLNRLFQPFFTTKDGKGGTGLGLSISRNIVESNQGSLEYALTSSGHTSFVILLPAVKSASESEQKPA